MTIWRGKDPLILASQSRARQMLLANAGISFEAVPADIDERAVQKDSGLSAPGEIAALLAREKALFVSSQNPGRYVVGADQTLALGEPAVQQAGRPRAGGGAIARCSPARPTNCIPPLRWRATARSCLPMSRCPNDDAAVERERDRSLSGCGRARRSRPASAPISSKGWACICSSASRATISPFSACRCCRCLHSCAAQRLLGV